MNRTASSSCDLIVLGGGIVGTWIAQEAAKYGATVRIVEVGPGKLVEQTEPRPSVAFLERENLGATRARHHVLTGNSGYWGGGLCRNDEASLQSMFGIGSASEAREKFFSSYDAIERVFGIEPSATGRIPPVFNGTSPAEIAVLPGKRRGVWSGFAEQVARGDNQIECYLGSRVEELHMRDNGTVDTVEIVDAEGRQHRLAAAAFVLSMGVIDSSLFALRHLVDAVPESSRALVGRCLHDHWSIPLARVRWKNGTRFTNLFPPKFQRGAIVGRRAALKEGFLHLTADFDAMPPYDRVKKLLGARQRNEPLIQQLGLASQTMGRPFLMARAGLHYLSNRELFVPDGSEVNLTFDFESESVPENHIRMSGEGRAELGWDLRPGDFKTFDRVVRDHRESICDALDAAGLGIEWLAGSGGDQTASYLSQHVIDAYHLGGGLQVAGLAGDGVVEEDLSLRGAKNLFVLGTSTFRRPGLANPVLTLLAQARQLVNNRLRNMH